MFKPSRMLHLPDRPAHSHYGKITGFQKPDESILLVLFEEIPHLVVSCPNQVYQAVHASSQKSALKENFFILLCRAGAQKRFQYLFFCEAVGRQRIFFLEGHPHIQPAHLPVRISLNSFLLPRQQIISVLNGSVPGLHSETSRAGAVNRSCIAQSWQKKGKISIIGKTHVPLGGGGPNPLKIHIIQNLTHQFPASAGNQRLILLPAIPLRQFFPAGIWGIADADSFFLITVGSQIQGMPLRLKCLKSVVKHGPIRLYATAKRRRYKADGSVLTQRYRISHCPLPPDFNCL